MVATREVGRNAPQDKKSVHGQHVVSVHKKSFLTISVSVRNSPLTRSHLALQAIHCVLVPPPVSSRVGVFSCCHKLNPSWYLSHRWSNIVTTGRTSWTIDVVSSCPLYPSCIPARSLHPKQEWPLHDEADPYRTQNLQPVPREDLVKFPFLAWDSPRSNPILLKLRALPCMSSAINT